MRSGTLDGPKLLATREDQGLTQAMLAAKVAKHLRKPVDPSTISHLECGRRQPAPALYAAICRALGVDRDALRQVMPDAPAV
jgi:transcriptional regulator with XRE-family HTH domain